MRTAVEELVIDNDRVKAVRLAGGETISGEQILSSAGLVETTRLCSDRENVRLDEKVGRLAFVELLAILDVEPRTIGIDKTIMFFDNEGPFMYRQPEMLTSLADGIICCPNNFEYKNPLSDGIVRITAQASYPLWRALVDSDNTRKASPEAQATYKAAKADAETQMLEEAVRHVPDFRDHIVSTEVFTPLTVYRYTGHAGGAIYGSPEKSRRGQTSIENLFLCGTDQGFLGIIGSMLSGISMANLHCLQ